MDELERERIEQEHGPPNPIPKYLYPFVNDPPIGESLRMVASTASVRSLSRLLDLEHLAGQVMLTLRDGSPWLEVAVAVPSYAAGRESVEHEVAELASGGLARRYAIWRDTERVYRIGPDGAVEDDPLELGEVMP